MNLEHPLTVEGYMGTEDMEYLASAASRSMMIVEIGSWHGRSTTALAANTQGLVFCVDTWSGNLEGLSRGLKPDLFATFAINTSPYPNVLTVRTDSLTAAQLFADAGMTFDFVFIDGSHDYESVKADILAWRGVLDDCGIMAGHDWGDQYPDVERAVTELIGKVKVIDKIWTTEL
jgi:predicted O-methyltransferase YrrM